jgi:peptidoglycan hydrolase-like protein with peptidoglycan-binding domain
MLRATVLALVLGAAPAVAEDVALVVGNGSYENARGLWGADDLAETAEAFEAAGFRIFTGEDLDAAALRRLASEFAAAADGSGRIAVALAGHFAQSAGGAWFLGTDTDAPDLSAAGAEGLSLATLYEIAARAPGRAVVLLGTEERAIRLGEGLAPGTGTLPVPQGVAVIRGDAAALAEFVGEALLDPGAGLASAVAGRSDLTAEGFVTDAVPFLGAAAGVPEEPEPESEPVRPGLGAERAAWAAALAEDTVEGYEAFLRRFPAGSNAALARAAIERLRAADPQAQARAAEDALALTRDQRRQVQRNLSLLGYNTRGIDGIFGPATRGALAAWQRANGEAETGFLTRTAVERIDAQAARRAAELEAEAASRQAEQERADRAWWAETGALGDEAGLRAYLRRYPDGLFAEVARERLAVFEDAREEDAAAADRAAWNRARTADTIEAYRAYLDAQPRGAFRARAEDRIEELRREAESAAAIRAENALGLNLLTRNLVEARLDALGLRPGRVDGVFDETTRRAIRRYQAARNLPATGYLTQDTVVRLLADSILR